ncbi:peroxiredoxin [Methylorubrum extorquens]|uniref:OsmC family protein n=1 Tax=Methylorubrum extorquens TaxID=408 RepID=UPI00097274AC|nr:OsmC family protein [Methylorubrum extorquens]APX85992.1 peroxiredoxin [Methylorubrum extorquens]
MTATATKEIVQTFEKVFEPIDRDKLQALSEKGRADPSVVKTVRARTVAEGRRFRHLNYIRSLDAHIVDEPPALLGDDTAPNPTEALLAALGTCVAVGLQANAIARGWTVKGIEVESEGDINITSVWGTGDLSEKPVGLTAVRLKVHLDVEGATAAELDELVAHAGQWSPVLNTVKNPISVTLARA